MADTKATGLSPFTPVLTDIVYGVDDPGGTPVSGKVTLQAVMDLFEANFQAPSDFIDSIGEIDATLRSGSDGTLITGTAGTSGDLVVWDANGDAVDGPTPPSGTIVGTSDAQSLINKTIDGDNNTISNLDIGNEVDWAAAADVTDASAFASGDKMLIFEIGAGLRKIDYDDLPGAGGGLSNVVEDTTPQLGGDLDVNGNAIVSASNGDIAITPNGTGSVVLDGLSWPQADGSANQVLKTDGAGQIGWATVSGGDVDGGSASSAGDAIQWRRDTAANWTSNDPTLAAGEAGYETDTGFIKVGDGSTAWTSLGYTLSGLADPGADRIVFWDDSAGAQAYLTAGTGLSISGTTLTVTGLTVSEIAAGSLTGSDTDLVTGTAGTSGNLVSWDANGDAVDSSIAASDVAVQAVTENAQTGTTYTLVLGDASKLVSMSNASANTLTIPTNASVAFPVGTTIVVMMKGAGTTTITGATGVTVNGVSAGSGDLSAQWGAVSLYKSATDTWYAMGSIGTVA